MLRHIWGSGGDLRRRLYEILEHGTIGDRTGLIVGRLIVVLIITNLVTMTLDSVPTLRAQYGPLFIAIELLSLVVGGGRARATPAFEQTQGPMGSSFRARSARSTFSRSCRSGSHSSCRAICGSCWCFAWCAFSRWRATRPPCARCWMLSTTSAALCSAAS